MSKINDFHTYYRSLNITTKKQFFSEAVFTSIKVIFKIFYDSVITTLLTLGAYLLIEPTRFVDYKKMLEMSNAYGLTPLIMMMYLIPLVVIYEESIEIIPWRMILIACILYNQWNIYLLLFFCLISPLIATIVTFISKYSMERGHE